MMTKSEIKRVQSEQKLKSELDNSELLNERNAIISELINSKIIDKFVSSVAFSGKYWREEFTQEIYKIICEIKPSRLIELYNKGCLYFYIVKCCRNQFFNKESYYNRHINRSKFKQIILEEYKNYEDSENTSIDI